MPKKACFGPEKPVDTSHPVCVLSPKEGGGFRTSCGYDRRPEGPGATVEGRFCPHCARRVELLQDAANAACCEALYEENLERDAQALEDSLRSVPPEDQPTILADKEPTGPGRKLFLYFDLEGECQSGHEPPKDAFFIGQFVRADPRGSGASRCYMFGGVVTDPDGTKKTEVRTGAGKSIYMAFPEVESVHSLPYEVDYSSAILDTPGICAIQAAGMLHLPLAYCRPRDPMIPLPDKCCVWAGAEAVMVLGGWVVIHRANIVSVSSTTTVREGSMLPGVVPAVSEVDLSNGQTIHVGLAPQDLIDLLYGSE